LVGGLAVILSAPVDDLPACLLVLAAACFSLLASSLSSIALAWFVTEAALFISAASGRRASAALGLAAGSTAALASLYASATSAGIGISQASLSPLTWLLALGAVALRLRLWPLSWPSASGPLRALWFLVGVVTGFAVLGRLAPALRPGELPQWATLVLLLSASGAGVGAWLTRGDRGRSLGWRRQRLLPCSWRERQNRRFLRPQPAWPQRGWRPSSSTSTSYRHFRLALRPGSGHPPGCGQRCYWYQQLCCSPGRSCPSARRLSRSLPC
jgi:hypothetical protein